MAQILVIDDEEPIRGVLVETLQSQGYTVASAGNGAAGVALAREIPPDLILCDIVMKGLDGYAVLAALRQDPRTAIIPVIFLTGMADPAAVRKGMEHGADDYLTKPMSDTDLFRAVKVRLARHGDARQEIRRRLDAMRANIARSLPHEFLTPLTSVMGLSSLLMDEAAAFDQNAIREVASGIAQGGQRLHQIILKFTLHVELETLRAAPPMDGAASLGPAETAALVEEVARAKAAAFAREGDLTVQAQPLSVAIPKHHLSSLLEEVLENAFAFSSTKSPVTVSWEPREETEGVLSVADAGRGMTSQQVAGLDRYTPSRRHDQEPGIGLGLAIVRRLVHLYKGHISFETAPGLGTTIEVRLPRATA